MFSFVHQHQYWCYELICFKCGEQVQSNFEWKFSWIPVAVQEETKHKKVILKQTF